jgi:hypothetical protein
MWPITSKNEFEMGPRSMLTPHKEEGPWTRVAKESGEFRRPISTMINKYDSTTTVRDLSQTYQFVAP